ncbi:MAG: hybrid sensor histidine kinase/response regulator [Bdellovibrionales bacterium]|nr:hybrid sensor histidine kinase/response regulator [Bdellovibrionales bacterium]
MIVFFILFAYFVLCVYAVLIQNNLLALISFSQIFILCLAVICDLFSIKDFLNNEITKGSRLKPNLLTGLGIRIFGFIEAHNYEKDNLEWEIYSKQNKINLCFKEFDFSQYSEREDFYASLALRLKQHFRCESCAIVFENKEVYTEGINDDRFKKSIYNFFKDFFYLEEGIKLGIVNLNDSICGIGNPKVFGFSFSLSDTFIDSSFNHDRKGVIWLGYTNIPLEVERNSLKEIVKKLGTELASYQALSNLNKEIIKVTETSSKKSEYISHMSHDIRSPLNNIKSILHVLKLESDNAEHCQLIEIALSNSDYLLEIVEDLLDFNRLQLGKFSSNADTFDVKDLASEVLNGYLYAINSKKLRAIFKSEEVPLLVSADKKQIKRVLSNLINNAIKFTNQGLIEVTIQRLDNLARITVRDTGMGIDKSKIEKLFSPFERLVDHKIEGIGLGLSLSKAILDSNYGSIRVNSELGRGTEFVVDLPITVGEFVEVKDNKKKLRVILLDDNPDFVTSISRGLESLGVETLKTYSVKQAIEKCEKYKPDYIISDLNMPGKGFKEVLASTAIKSACELIVVTGSSSSEILNLSSMNHVRAVLHKPVIALEIYDLLLKLEAEKDRDRDIFTNNSNMQSEETKSLSRKQKKIGLAA